jgi:hypothetical protein
LISKLFVSVLRSNSWEAKIEPESLEISKSALSLTFTVSTVSLDNPAYNWTLSTFSPTKKKVGVFSLITSPSKLKLLPPLKIEPDRFDIPKSAVCVIFIVSLVTLELPA